MGAIGTARSLTNRLEQDGHPSDLHRQFEQPKYYTVPLFFRASSPTLPSVSLPCQPSQHNQCCEKHPRANRPSRRGSNACVPVVPSIPRSTQCSKCAPLGPPPGLESTASVASVVNSLPVEHEGEGGAEDERRSQPFCYEIPEVLPSIAHALL